MMVATKLNIKNNVELQKTGLAALKNALGVTGTLKFLEQFDQGGSGDYTKEKYNIEEESAETIREKLGNDRKRR